MRMALRRFTYCTSQDDSIVDALQKKAYTTLASGYRVCLVAFRTSPPNEKDPGYHVVLLKDVTYYLGDYIGNSIGISYVMPALGIGLSAF